MRQGHVSIIVGGSRGIGQAIARALAARGGNVFVIGRNRERVDATLKDLEALGAGRHIGRVLDAAVPDDMAQMAAVCTRNVWTRRPSGFFRRRHGLRRDQPITPQMLDLPLVAWRKALDVNLHGVFLANKAVLPLMVRQGEGDIINIGSALTRHGMRGRAHGGGVLGNKICARRLHASSGIGGE